MRIAQTLTKFWATALSDVSQLNTDGTMNSNDCGDTSNGGSHQTDWHLPNVKELLGLIHYVFYGPAVPNTEGTGKWTAGDPFTNVQSTYYWSITTYAPYNYGAWTVYMHNGYVFNDGKSIYRYVWPVRSGN